MKAAKRVKMDLQEMEEAIQQKNYKAIHPGIDQVILKDDNIMRWVVLFHGVEQSNTKEKEAGTPLYPGNYGIQVNFGDEYPAVVPSILMMGGFEHFHVYKGGKICHPMLTKWTYKYSMRQLLTQIINMLHSPPTVGDQANPGLKHLIPSKEKTKDQFKLYYEYMANQAKNFQGRKFN